MAHPSIADIAQAAGVSKGAVSFPLNKKARGGGGDAGAHPAPPGDDGRGPVLPGLHRRRRGGADGARLLLAPAHGRCSPTFLAELGLPAVIVGPADERSACPGVGIADAPGIRAAVQHLLDLGHTGIAHVSGPVATVHGRSRVMAGLSWATSRGVRVPEDLSITGYDDTELAAHLEPSLTTVRTNVLGWGRAAAQRLPGAIEQDDQNPIELPPAQLVVRRSTGPAPTHPVSSLLLRSLTCPGGARGGARANRTGGDTRRRFAVYGTGHRAGMYVTAMRNQHADVAVPVAWCDTNETRMRHYDGEVSELGIIPGHYRPEDLERMLAEESVDVLLVCSPDHTHAHAVSTALRADVDVVCEKPLTTDAAGLRQINEAVEASSSHLTVTFNHRYSPRISALRQVIAGGTIGRPLSVHFEGLARHHPRRGLLPALAP